MKQLSIEEKAKAYDEALKVLHKYDGANIMFSQSLKEEMFPELKESEDERIRKEIISALKYANHKGVYDKHITWLEKQGKQKPVDKVELKFHEDDWVATSYGKVNQVVSVNKDGDGYTLDDDTYVSGSWCDMYHLWTTQDAKPGDILAADPIKGIEGFSSSFIAIYKKRNGEDFDSYCFVGFNGKFDKNGIEHSTDRVHPATKEQRDLLFQKMEEAGYDWDTEVMKLEEIKYNKRQWKNHDEEMINGISNFIGYNQDLVEGGVDEWLDWLKNLENKIQLKQEWSEDDEKAINDIMWIIEAYRKNGFNETHKQMANNAEKWLKSIKDRVGYKVDCTTTKEWSLDDELMLYDIITCGERHCYLDAGNIAWIKELKNRVQPQPKQSENQVIMNLEY